MILNSSSHLAPTMAVCIFGKSKVVFSFFIWLNHLGREAHNGWMLCVCVSVWCAEVVNPGEDRARGRWQRKAQLSDSKKAVNDVQFAPRHLGLKLAAASADGIVRIYEASDVFSLNYWPLQVGKFDVVSISR